MSNKARHGTRHLFATIGSHTAQGGWVATATGSATYRGLQLARVGDVVRYDDGSEAVIIDGAGIGAVFGDRPAALVGSHLSNGDLITRTLQDHAGIDVAPEKTIAGLFDAQYAVPQRATRYRAATRGSTTARGGVLREACGHEPDHATEPAGTIGDTIHYRDGTTARIATGLRLASQPDMRAIAFVGSELDNGDTITDSPDRTSRYDADMFIVVAARDVPEASAR